MYKLEIACIEGTVRGILITEDGEVLHDIYRVRTERELLEKLNQSHITYEEFIRYHQEHYADLKYYTDEKPKDGKEYYPSVVSDICKEISLHKFWNQSEN